MMQAVVDIPMVDLFNVITVLNPLTVFLIILLTFPQVYLILWTQLLPAQELNHLLVQLNGTTSERVENMLLYLKSS